MKGFLTKFREIIKANKQAKARDLIAYLNPVIRGWANFHRHVVSSRPFSKVDAEIFKARSGRWARRRHLRKGAKWIRSKYFGSHRGRTWTFQGEVYIRGERRMARLFYAGDVGIRRHVKVKGEANPYDPTWRSYFERRSGVAMADLLGDRPYLLMLWERQRGLRPRRGQKIESPSGWHNHHVVRKVDGGSEGVFNRVLLHPNCHQQVHSQESEVNRTGMRLCGALEEACEEPYAGKLASTVLRGPGARNGLWLPDYVAAERVHNRFLADKPVGVLGNQGACVIAKSYEMKAFRVKTGRPIWKAMAKCAEYKILVEKGIAEVQSIRKATSMMRLDRSLRR